MSRQWQPGDLLATPLSRVMNRLTVTDDGCWETDFTRCRGGYASIRSRGKMRKLHREVYLVLVGPIRDGLDIDHLCRNRACCNPSHLEPVLPALNTLRGDGKTADNSRKTHCDHGHEFTPENTAIRTDGSRRCITCRRRHRMAHYYRNQVSA